MTQTTVDTLVREALAADHIGVPVAARWFLSLDTEVSQLTAWTTVALHLLEGWFDSDIDRLFARQHANHVSVQVRFQNGQTALVSSAAIPARPPQFHLLVFGQRGMLNWQEDGEHFRGLPVDLDDSTAGTRRQKPDAQARGLDGLDVNDGAAGTRRQKPDAQARGPVGLDLNDGTAETRRQKLAEAIHASLVHRHVVHASRLPTTQPADSNDAADRTEPAVPVATAGSVMESVERDNFARCQPPFGVLLVAGDHTHQPGYAEAFLADGRVRLVAVTDELDIAPGRRAWNEQFAQRLAVPYIPDLHAALARDDVQVVSVCAEPYRRGRIIVAAAQAGKHLYLDKPLAGSCEDARAIVAAVRQHGVASHMFSQVHWPPATEARELVASGRLGQVIAVHCDLCFAKGHPGTADLARPRRESAAPTRFELPEAKRELTNVGVYSVVFLLWLLQREIHRVFAVTGNYFFAEHQRHDMEDFGQMLLELEGGVTASVTAGRTGWQSHPSAGLNRIYLVGTEAVAVVDAHLPRLETWSASAAWSPPDRDPNDPMAMWAAAPDSPYRAAPKTAWATSNAAAWSIDVRHFFDRLEAGQASDVPADLAARSTAALMAAYRSAAETRVAEVERIV